MCTMQAPHKPVPQPNLVPVSLRSSRITHNNGVAAGASVVAGLPFTMNFVAIASSLCPHGAKAVAGRIDHPAAVRELQWAGDDAAPPTDLMARVARPRRARSPA